MYNRKVYEPEFKLNVVKESGDITLKSSGQKGKEKS